MADAVSPFKALNGVEPDARYVKRTLTSLLTPGVSPGSRGCCVAPPWTPARYAGVNPAPLAAPSLAPVAPESEPDARYVKRTLTSLLTPGSSMVTP
jgi:hypothetical protein